VNSIAENEQAIMDLTMALRRQTLRLSESHLNLRRILAVFVYKSGGELLLDQTDIALAENLADPVIHTWFDPGSAAKLHIAVEPAKPIKFKEENEEKKCDDG